MNSSLFLLNERLDTVSSCSNKSFKVFRLSSCSSIMGAAIRTIWSLLFRGCFMVYYGICNRFTCNVFCRFYPNSFPIAPPASTATNPSPMLNKA